MPSQRLTGRQVKVRILALLQKKPLPVALEQIGRFPPRQAVNPLFSFFYHHDEMVRWRAIVAMGAVVARLAQDDLESARVVMRRLMWNLNDESGGIGWGSPEAMGEILACSPVLAKEFAHILVSYIREDMNYLEHERLQQGVLWGLARSAEVRPEWFQTAGPHLLPFMKSADPILRGLAAKTAVSIGDTSLRDALSCLADDHTIIRLFIVNQMVETTVAELAIMDRSRVG